MCNKCKFDHFKSIQNLSNQHPNLNYHTRVGTAGAQLEWLLCSSSCKHTAEHQKRLIDYSVAATLAHTQQSSYKWAKNNYCYRASAQLKTECEHIECTRVPSTELNRPWPQQLTELNEMSQHPIERHELITQFTHTNHDHVMRTTKLLIYRNTTSFQNRKSSGYINLPAPAKGDWIFSRCQHTASNMVIYNQCTIKLSHQQLDILHIYDVISYISFNYRKFMLHRQAASTTEQSKQISQHWTLGHWINNIEPSTSWTNHSIRWKLANQSINTQRNGKASSSAHAAAGWKHNLGASFRQCNTSYIQIYDQQACWQLPHASFKANSTAISTHKSATTLRLHRHFNTVYRNLNLSHLSTSTQRNDIGRLQLNNLPAQWFCMNQFSTNYLH